MSKVCCQDCGSLDVEYAVWFNPNTETTGEIFGSWNAGDSTFCADCGENTSLVDSGSDSHGFAMARYFRSIHEHLRNLPLATLVARDDRDGWVDARMLEIRHRNMSAALEHLNAEGDAHEAGGRDGDAQVVRSFLALLAVEPVSLADVELSEDSGRGALEAFPNGLALTYDDDFGLDEETTAWLQATGLVREVFDDDNGETIWYLPAPQVEDPPPAPEAGDIDRIDIKGDIRQHRVHPKDPDRTVCGLRLTMTQAPSVNRKCRRCYPT